MDPQELYRQAEELEDEARERRSKADDLRREASDLDDQARELEVTAGVRRSEAVHAESDQSLAERMSTPPRPLI